MLKRKDMATKYRDIFSKAVSIYVSLLCSYCIIGWVAVFNLQQIVYTVVSTAFALAGIVLVLLEVLIFHNLKKIPHNAWLILFLVAIAVSAVATYSYGVFSNLKTLAWCAIQVFIMVPMVVACNGRDLKRAFKIFFVFTFTLWSVVSLVSLLMYIVQLGFSFEDATGKIQRQGYIDGRLFGAFIDPNYASCASLCLVMAATYYLKKTDLKSAVRKWILFGCALNLIYFILAESRTGYVALAAILLSWIIFRLRSNPEKRIDCLSALRAIGYSSVVVAIIVGLTITAHLYSEVIQENDFYGMNAVTEEYGLNISHRTDAGSENISNNRFDIWSDYVYVMKDHYLTGLSPRNYDQIVLEQYPDLYISNRNEDSIYGIHNGYLSVYVYTGVLGVIAMAVIAAVCLYSVTRILLRRSTKEEMLIALLIFLVISVKAITHTTPFFSYSAEANFFWIMIGVLLYSVSNQIKMHNGGYVDGSKTNHE